MSTFRHERRQTAVDPPAPMPSPGAAVRQRTDASAAARAVEPSSAVAHALSRPGRPLDGSVREAAERQLGFDFGSVRIHTDEQAATSAQTLHARAFTLGPHIIFAEGQYDPGSEAGRHQLMHELSHVVQQSPGSPMPVSQMPVAPLQVGAPDSPQERQADRLARAASPGEARSLLAGAGALPPAVVARQPAPGAAKSPPTPREVAERQGRNAYPNNPRGAALQAKMNLGTITKDETSELRGIASFPDNPRAALLYAKQDAGTIKPAEQEELRGYFQRQAARDLALHPGSAPSASPGGESPRAAALRAKQAQGPLSRDEQAELTGLNAYPDNPRAAALHAKQILGPLSREEQAELQGFNAYPNNRRAAALHAKQVLGTLSREESAELQGFIAHPTNRRAAALHTKQVLGPLSLQERAELQGFNAYPNNPRAAALYAKQMLGPLSREESAELQGINAYPRHPRAAALYAKKVLGTITWQEQNELSDEEWYRAMGEFLIRLERKAREGRLWPEQRDTYERLRVNPKVRQRAFEILESGGPSPSLIDD